MEINKKNTIQMISIRNKEIQEMFDPVPMITLLQNLEAVDLAEVDIEMKETESEIEKMEAEMISSYSLPVADMIG